MASGNLHRDLSCRIRAVIAGAMDATAVAQPVALCKDADHLGPAWVVTVGAIGRDVPFVWSQRPARCLLGPCLRGALRAQPPQFIERAIVVRKGRRSGFAGNPIHVPADSRIE